MLSEMTEADRDLYRLGVTVPHEVTARAHLLTRDHVLVEDVTPWLVDGQTNLQDAPIVRTASATFLDPHREINDGRSFRPAHMLQAWSLVDVETLPYVVKVPVFCGPITGKADEGDTVAIELQDKGYLAATDVPVDSWAKNARATDVIREVLQTTGETRFGSGFRGVPARIEDEVTVGEDEEIWPLTVALGVAESVGLQLLVDTEGVWHLREAPTEPSHVYRTGALRSTVTEPVAVSEDWAAAVNRLVLRGKAGIVATAKLAAADEMSPESLGRNGVPWRASEVVENDKIGRQAKAKEVAERKMKRSGRRYADVQFSALPARDSEHRDVQRVETGRGGWDFELTECSIPWTSGVMSVGFQRQVSRTPTRIRLTSRQKKRRRGKKKRR